jgi:hypothetical protein
MAMRRNDFVAGVYIGSLVAAGGFALVLSLRETISDAHDSRILAWAGLAVLTIALGRLAVRLPFRQCRVSVSDVFLFASAVLFGPGPATINAALDGYAASARAGGTWYKRLFNTASMALSINLSSHLFASTSPAHGLQVPGPHSAIDYLLPLALMAVAQYALNTTFVAVVVMLKEGVSFTAVWQDTTPWAGGAYLFGAAALGAVLLLARAAGPIAFLALLPMPVLLYFTYRSWLAGVDRGKGGFTH